MINRTQHEYITYTNDHNTDHHHKTITRNHNDDDDEDVPPMMLTGVAKVQIFGPLLGAISAPGVFIFLIKFVGSAANCRGTKQPTNLFDIVKMAGWWHMAR